MTDREVDPRFDPRYQRGFDPAVHGDSPPSLSRPQADLHAAAETQTTVPSDVAPTRPVAAAADRGVDTLDQREPDDHDDLDLSARNPYRLALLVISLASLVIGVGAVWATATAQNSIYARQDSVAIFLVTVADALAPALVSAAVIGFVIWIALGAVLRRGPRDD